LSSAEVGNMLDWAPTKEGKLNRGQSMEMTVKTIILLEIKCNFGSACQIKY